MNAIPGADFDGLVFSFSRTSSTVISPTRNASASDGSASVSLPSCSTASADESGDWIAFEMLQDFALLNRAGDVHCLLL